MQAKCCIHLTPWTASHSQSFVGSNLWKYAICVRSQLIVRRASCSRCFTDARRLGIVMFINSSYKDVLYSMKSPKLWWKIYHQPCFDMGSCLYNCGFLLLENNEPSKLEIMDLVYDSYCQARHVHLFYVTSYLNGV